MSGLIDYISSLVAAFVDLCAAFGGFGKQIFCRQPEYLLTFVGLGMAIVVLALSQTVKKIDHAEQIKSKIYNREIPEQQLFQAAVYEQAKNDYWKFITLVEKIGAAYFISASLIAILITYPYPPATPIPNSYLFLSNISYFLLIIPTIIITTYYLYYRLFKYRLH